MKLTIQYHAGNQNICRIPELAVRPMPECEGGGWWMPKDQAEHIVSCVSGYADTTVDALSPLPSWADLAAYWKDRAEKAEAKLDVTEEMQDAGFKAIEEYERMKVKREFPRPTLPAYIFINMVEAASR